jgi:glycosyltransferase involved in cell wall biosynthesis
MRIVEVAFSGTIGTREMGPVSTDICELSNRFASRGHQVTVVDICREPPRELLHPAIELVELSGVPESQVESCKTNNVRKFLMRWHNCLRYVRQLSSKLDLSQVDIIHFHSPVIAFIAQRLYGIRAFYTAHTPLWSLEHNSGSSDSGRQSFRRTIVGEFDAWIERDVMCRGRLTVGLGSYLAASVPQANVVTIPNGLDLDGWNRVDKTAARDALKISARDFVVVFAGRIKYVKGVDLLLEAVKLLAPLMPDLKVLIIGPLSGSFDSRDRSVNPFAQQMIERSQGLPVRYLGFISNQDLTYRQHLAAADVFVLPSRSEPLGMVVLESLAMGTPVIGAATGGIPDMVSRDVGYLFQPGDIASLAARIREAHDNPDALSGMRRAARARVESRFSWDEIADRYLAAFERTLSTAECGTLACERRRT